VFRVTAAGQGMQRKYFVKLFQRPGQAQDNGVKWIESQKAGVAVPTSGGH